VTKQPEDVKVGKLPYFETELQTETIWEEEDEIIKHFVVKAKGTPKPKLRWYKNDVEIVPNEEYEIEENDEEISILTIRKRPKEIPQKIVCEAVNEHGSVTTKTLIIPGRDCIFFLFERI